MWKVYETETSISHDSDLMDWLRVASHPWPLPLQTGWIRKLVITLHHPIDAIAAICILWENSIWPRMPRCYETRRGCVWRQVLENEGHHFEEFWSLFQVHLANHWGFYVWACKVHDKTSLWHKKIYSTGTLLCFILLFDLFKDKRKRLKGARQTCPSGLASTCLGRGFE